MLFRHVFFCVRQRTEIVVTDEYNVNSNIEFSGDKENKTCAHHT